MTGGGLALLDTETGKFRMIPHTRLAENEAPFALAALSNELLLVGTTIAPGTGGEMKAKEASLLLVDINSGETVWRSKELGEIYMVVNLLAMPDGDAIGIDSEYRFFRFELAARRIIPGVCLKEWGELPITQGPRLLHRDKEDIWLLFKSGAGKIDPQDGSITAFVPVDPGIRTTGAVRDGVLYYVGNMRWCSVSLADALKDEEKRFSESGALKSI